MSLSSPKIEFRNVTFCYPTELRTPVLQGMNLVVEPGQKVALVGATGTATIGRRA